MRSCLAILLLLLVSGCATAYKSAVSTWSRHAVEYAAATCDCRPDASGALTEHCLSTWFGPAAGLRCLVNEDEGRKGTHACACARPASATERRAACTAWMKERD